MALGLDMAVEVLEALDLALALALALVEAHLLLVVKTFLAPMGRKLCKFSMID